MALMREVDDMADEEHLSRTDIMQRLESFDGLGERYPHLVPTGDNIPTHHRLYTTAGTILQTGEQLADTTTIDAYINHRTREAHATAQLFEDSASESVRSQPELQQNFLPLLRALGEAACFLDSAKDLAKDYQEGRTLLPPTFPHRTQLLRASINKLPEVLPLLPHLQIQRQLGRAAIIHIARRF